MSDNRNRRQFQRISFDAPVEISQGTLQCPSKVMDISLKGILVAAPTLALDIGKPVSIRIQLSEHAQIVMTADWAGKRDGCLAFNWIQVDIESMMHLRRLLELNTGDQSLIEREISRLAGADDAADL